ncbi:MULTISPECIES: transcription termination/antitermination protein NusG [unclassified Roseivivax]|uniref:transcription termination/antitermination protein NusG n=1 Tax=Roseivivax sp. GX 12232 TaxID=2900547 RepID=UPI001E5E4EF7|nr:transcription termination/antitermination NusG family protein [Roseivivax sp. GX 12232]MCE0505073.1 transcriptional activator RfaH [Roseivivax sp. GX 12232]
MDRNSDTQNPRNWFAAQLKPNGLTLAERNLARQGFAHFAPRRMETTRRAGKLTSRPRPLFPGYVFVQFDPAGADWRKLNATRGLTRVVLDDPRHPRPLPQDFMAGLLARCDRDEVLETVPAFAEGDLVRVINGPMAMLVSRIEALGDDDRIRLLMEFMGQKTRVTVPAVYLEKIEA